MGVIVRQKTKGKGMPWWVFVTHQGKRQSMKVGDKKSAEKVARELRTELAKGNFNIERQKEKPTFEEYSQKWIEQYVKVNLRESTFDEYDGILRNHVLPKFKDEKIDEVNRGQIRDFLLSKYSGGLSQKRVMLLKDVVSGVLNFALDEELISSNPTTGITKRLFPKNGNKKRTVEKEEVFTKEELEKFLDVSKKHFPEYYPFFLMASRTGMRLGELLAIRWGDIDFNSSYFWVKRSYRRGRHTAPKNDKSRKVDMSKQLAETLKAHLTSQKRQTLKKGLAEMPELVHHRDGRVMEQNYIRRIYFRALKKAKIRKVKFHGIRHTFCAHLLSEGVTPYYVCQQAGHSSINITCDVYGSWISTDENRHVNLLDSLHPSAPYKHPAETEKPQPIEIEVKSS